MPVFHRVPALPGPHKKPEPGYAAMPVFRSVPALYGPGHATMPVFRSLPAFVGPAGSPPLQG